MIKKLLILILLFGAPRLWANTYTATSCSAAAFSTALASAVDGDTVQGPSGGGSGTWSSNVTINVGITLNFNGCVFSNSGTITINLDSTSMVITNGTFSSCYTNGNSPFVINMANGPSTFDAIFRMYNMTFGGGGTCLATWGLGPGLIDHNTFNGTGGADEVLHIMGPGAGCTTCWNADVVPGGSNMVFIENNNYAYTGEYCQGEEANYGAILVFRYNHLAHCQNDVHGGPTSTRWIELYKNTYSSTTGNTDWFDWRGGSGVYWGNSLADAEYINVGPICGSSDICGTSPVQYAFGMGIGGLTNSPAYIWGNTNLTSISQVTNRDSAMVQLGTASVDAAHCSGLSGLPANSCNAIFTSSQPATLLRCESAADESAGCPVSYSYTPYTYPHPLDNCPTTTFGPATCSSGHVAPPSGLTDQVQ